MAGAAVAVAGGRRKWFDVERMRGCTLALDLHGCSRPRVRVREKGLSQYLEQNEAGLTDACWRELRSVLAVRRRVRQEEQPCALSYLELLVISDEIDATGVQCVCLVGEEASSSRRRSQWPASQASPTRSAGSSHLNDLRRVDRPRCSLDHSVPCSYFCKCDAGEP